VIFEQALKDAKATQEKLSEQAATLGPAGQRADRDFRKQTIMTIRTLFLENLLGAFMVAFLAVLPQKVSVEQVLKLLFERSGSRIERDQEMMYWVNAKGYHVQIGGCWAISSQDSVRWGWGREAKRFAGV